MNKMIINYIIKYLYATHSLYITSIYLSKAQLSGK